MDNNIRTALVYSPCLPSSNGTSSINYVAASTRTRQRDLYRNLIILRDVYGPLWIFTDHFTGPSAKGTSLRHKEGVHQTAAEWLTHTGMKLPANRVRIAVKYLHSLRIKARGRCTALETFQAALGGRRDETVTRSQLREEWLAGMCLQILRWLCLGDIRRGQKESVRYLSAGASKTDEFAQRRGRRQEGWKNEDSPRWRCEHVVPIYSILTFT